MKNSEVRELTNGRSGFTLIEVLLVVAILGILAGVVVANFGGKQKGAMIKAARTSISAISLAVDMFEIDTGRYPASLNSLVSSDGSRSPITASKSGDTRSMSMSATSHRRPGPACECVDVRAPRVESASNA